MGEKAIIWFSDRFGMRNHASWGSQNDVFAMFFTQEAFYKFKRSKEEAELQDALDKEKKKVEADKKDKKKEKKAKEVKKQIKRL